MMSVWATNMIIECPEEVNDDFIKEIIAIGEEYEAQHPEAHVPRSEEHTSELQSH